jgi:hypothetical protein
VGFDKAAYKATFITATDLLRDAADALDNDPSTDKRDELLHPEDAYCAAASALETVAGLFISLTERAAGR